MFAQLVRRDAVVAGVQRAVRGGGEGAQGDQQVAQFPTGGVPVGEEGQGFLAVGLGGEVLPVFGDVADEEHRLVEHDEVLLAVMAAAGQEFFAGHVEQLDGHAARVVLAVELRVGVAVGEAHPGVPALARFGEHAATQGRVEVGAYLELGLHAAVGLGVGIAQDAGVVAVLFDHADGVLDDRLGDAGFVRGNLLFRGHRAGEFPGVVEAADGPAAEADGQQQEEQAAEPFAEEQPGEGEECAHGVGVLGGVRWLWAFILLGRGVRHDCFSPSSG